MFLMGAIDIGEVNGKHKHCSLLPMLKLLIYLSTIKPPSVVLLLPEEGQWMGNPWILNVVKLNFAQMCLSPAQELERKDGNLDLVLIDNG